MTTAALLTATFVIFVGVSLHRANPHRLTNQVFAFGALLLGLELFFIHKSIEAGMRFASDGTTNPLPWVRASASLKMIFPWLLWLLGESIIHPNKSKWHTIRSSAGWFGSCFGLSLATFSNWYIPANSLPDNISKGPGYVILISAGLVAWLLVITRSLVEIRKQAGIRRIEMQFLVINLSIAAFLTLALFAAGHILSVPVYKHLSMFLVLGGFAVTAWGITYHRIFDVRHVLLSLIHRILLVAFLICGFLVIQKISDTHFLSPGDGLLCLAVSCSAAFWLDRKSLQWFGLGGQQIQAEMRLAVIELARTEPETERLIDRFEELLRQKCRISFATLLFERGDAFESEQLSLAKRLSWHSSLCELGWITPESLQRRRTSLALDELRDFLAVHSLGLIITVPRGSPTPALLLAFGTKTDESPFTYPEVERLQNIAELMDNILIRSRLNAQAALQSRIEYLAMMSRGLAHDLKNLITPVSTFLVHTDGTYPTGSAEAEVHSAARRAMRIMTDYFREAMFFAERLNPHFEHIDLSQLLSSVQCIASTRAGLRSVSLEFKRAEDNDIVADSVLLQRLFTNLVHNAIDASSPGQSVRLSTSLLSPDHVRFEVSDDGDGISPENLARVFEPYFTTKVFGDEVRGFGLGLTICQTIAELHNGRIDIRSEPGRGTTVTVVLPRTQGSTDPIAGLDTPRNGGTRPLTTGSTVLEALPPECAPTPSS